MLKTFLKNQKKEFNSFYRQRRKEFRILTLELALKALKRKEYEGDNSVEYLVESESGQERWTDQKPSNKCQIKDVRIVKEWEFSKSYRCPENAVRILIELSRLKNDSIIDVKKFH
jgi:hypothetical protein